MQNDCVCVDQGRLGKAGTGPPLEEQAPFCQVGTPYRPSVRRLFGSEEVRRSVKGDEGK